MKIFDMKYKLLFIVILMTGLPVHVSSTTKTTITFPSLDGIEISADIYLRDEDKSTPLIILFHQAGWSRGEYLEIAPNLNTLGFNCMAIDLRSGGSINGIDNRTVLNAVQAQKSTQYIDALPDIEAAILYARKNYNQSKIIVWGSSYSASLVLHIAGTKPDLVDGALAFAPGEYFTKQGKSKSWIGSAAAKINVPVFITSARDEQKSWSSIYSAIKYKEKSSFIPATKGNHGSRALWKQFDDSEAYWNAVEEFLKNNFL